MKTPLTYYGGKQSMLPIILPLIPKHLIYVEPFLGGGAVFWAKEKSEVEVVNDTSKEVINFYHVAQKHYKKLEKEVQTTLHSRAQHNQAVVVYENSEMFTPVKRAWALWVLSSQSFGASLGSGWRYGRSKKVEWLIDTKRRRFTKAIQARLEKTQIECTNALRVIKTRDTKDTFFYCDPPYFNANMGHYKGYTEADFEDLLKSLSNIKGKFLLSSYASPLLSEYTKRNKWQSVSVKKKIPLLNQKSKDKVEVLTANYDIKFKLAGHSL